VRSAARSLAARWEGQTPARRRQCWNVIRHWARNGVARTLLWHLDGLMNLTALFNDVHEAVLRAATAQGAWSEIVGIVEKTGLSIPPAVRDSDLASQVRELAKQLRDLFERTPLPQDLTFIYFGLFTAANPVTFEEEAGFYVAGGTSNDPEVVR